MQGTSPWGTAMKFTELYVNGEDRTAEMREIARVIGLDALCDRYSSLLHYQLAVSYLSGNLTHRKVMREIEALEKGLPTATKPPTMFKGPILGGLWHKHYPVDGLASVATNLRNGLIKNGLPLLEQVVEDAEAAGREIFVEDVLDEIVFDAVTGNLERRSMANEMTGEWIIYAHHEGANYYLCLANHRDGDERIRAQIDETCAAEFPFLKDLLAAYF